MEETQTSPFKIALTYGIYMALISIVISLVIWGTKLIESLGMMGSTIVSFFNLAVMVTLLFVFTKLYRDNFLGGKISFKQAFLFGVLIVVCSSLITGLFSYILNRYIDPDYTQRVMTAMQQDMYQMLTNKGTPDDQIDEMMRIFEEKEAISPLQAVQQSIFIGFIGGAFMSLISSAIVKRDTRKKEAFDAVMEDIENEKK